MTPLRMLLLGASLLALPAATFAGEGDRAADQVIVTSQGFLSDHPDLMYRLRGLEAYRRQDYDVAMSAFRHAARYADKPAQGMVAEMLWKGQGVAVDRPLAYVWMDIAAERGYPVMLVQRERYWAELDAGERERALQLGEAVLAEFGDAAAKPRLERKLRLARRQVTGSRVGSVGNLQIILPTPAGDRVVDGAHYYHEKFWQPELYWRWQDQDWREPPKGRVDVGALQTAPSTPAPPRDDPPPGEPGNDGDGGQDGDPGARGGR